MLDMDDLATLDGQNWLNDQVSARGFSGEAGTG